MSRATTTLRTMWDVMIADPVRGGRLRLDGLPPVTRQLSIAGVVVLGGLLLSLVFNDLWRRGPLTLVRDFEQAPNLAARGVIPFTLIAVAVAWTLILAGAALARPLLATLVAVAFLLANSGSSDAFVTSDDSVVLRLGPELVLGCYFAAAALAVVVSVLRRRSRWPVARALAAVALGASVVAFFGGQLAIYVAEESRGDLVSLPRSLDGTLNGLQGFLVPLFILAVAGLVQLNHHVAEGLVTPLWELPARVVKVLVVVLIAVKLRYALLGRVDDWTAYVVERRAQALQAVAFLVLLAGAAWLFRRHRDAGSDDDVQTEPLVYGASLLLSFTVLLVGVVTNVSLFLAARGAEGAGQWVIEEFPTSFVIRYLLLSLFAVVLLAGIALTVRRRGTRRDRVLGGAMVVVAAWVVPNLALQQLSERDVGFDIGFLDLLLTLVALVYMVVRWRRLDTPGAVRVGALLVFASLVAGNGYVATRLVSKVLASFTPPAVLLIVIGVLYVMFADSSFASASSANFPRETRALLWIGYIIFVVAVTNYVLVAREAEYRIEYDRFAFQLLALPMAAWLAVRSRMTAPPPSS